MTLLRQAIKTYVVEHIRHAVGQLHGPDGELRAVFNGPHLELLRQVYESISGEGGLIATLASGQQVKVPVLLQVPVACLEGENPAIGESGLCDANYLLNLRNATGCPRFLALVPPGSASSLSQTSTRSDFGLQSFANSGSASITDWINDPFIQYLIDGAVGQQKALPEREVRDAKALIHRIVRAASDVNEHDTSRNECWLALCRCWDASSHANGFAHWLSLATGFPPTKENKLEADEQAGILRQLAERFEEASIHGALGLLAQRTVSAVEQEALKAFGVHLSAHLEALTVICRALPAFYAPFQRGELGSAPRWWVTLTVECWRRLLDGGDEPPPPPKGAVRIECINPLFPVSGGMVAVVQDEVQLRITADELTRGKEATVTRLPGSGNRNWAVVLDNQSTIIDEGPPKHQSPMRYSVSANGDNLASCRAVSLATWVPGIIVTSRTATKTELPKAPRGRGATGATYQASIVMQGEGRHYLDVYTAPGIALDLDVIGADETSTDGASTTYRLGRVTDSEHGVEIDASSECRFDITFWRDDATKPEVLRLLVTCDDLSPRQCRSEYERLLQLNSRKGKGSIPDVQINRQVRSADLQSWMLDPALVAHSYYPVVLGPDYSAQWRQRDWLSAEDTILSRGRFLHDPRPRVDLMVPPKGLVDARERIASRIRGDDGNGLVEGARLGEWLATSAEFAEDVEAYLRAFQDWLDADPDVAAWCDLVLVTRLEQNGSTLAKEPYAVLLSPLHPLRLAWHCIVQRALFLTARKLPCPAASVLDPDNIPDSLVLSIKTVTGAIKKVPFLSVECSSDYWGIQWNANEFDTLPNLACSPPFDPDFGVLVGGISSGFSVSQVHRALSDMSEMHPAQPTLTVLLTSAAGQNSACNEGVISWCQAQLGNGDDEDSPGMGRSPATLEVIDERAPEVRPQDAEISNLAEDTDNRVKWYGRAWSGLSPDIAIIAQLETSNPAIEVTRLGSAVSAGGFLRARIRQQLGTGDGAFLLETRTGTSSPTSGDLLADRVASAMLRMENLGDRYAYTFAPSVPTIQRALKRATFAAVSSAAIDPACFLGSWLNDSYLWDYDLPSYSSRSGDNNGYYLLSRVKDVDREGLGDVLRRLPDCKELADSFVDALILEVARRGIPTVRGLASGTSGASGDLGLFVAARLLQDDFRIHGGSPGSLVPVWAEPGDGTCDIVLVIPVDPFRGYMEDLGRALSMSSASRPDFLVAWVRTRDGKAACKLTPIEVKFRGGSDVMGIPAKREALSQARAMSDLLTGMFARSFDADAPVWKSAYQHFLLSVLDFGFRVYSQQLAVSNRGGAIWADNHAAACRAILCDELSVEVDPAGRLVVIDASPSSMATDIDDDGKPETLVISMADASRVVRNLGEPIYTSLCKKLSDWDLSPSVAVVPTTPEGGNCQSPYNDDAVVDETAPEPGLVQALPATTSAVVPAQELEGEKPPGKGEGTGVSLIVGTTIDTLQSRIDHLELGNTALNQLNIGVVGDLGTGKTQLLKSLIWQVQGSKDANFGIQPSFLVFDYKKDYSDEKFVAASGARVIKPYRLPVNPFDLSGSVDSNNPRLGRFKFFADVLDKIYSGVGPVQRNNLKLAVMKAYEAAGSAMPTVYDIAASYQAVTNGKSDSVSSIIGDLVDMELFTPDPAAAKPFSEFCDGVVVIALNELGQDDRSKNMLVAFMLNMFYERMLQIEKRSFRGKDGKARTVDSFLLVDEADNIMRYEFDVLRRLLLQGREFGVGVVLASQYLSHFKVGATDYREPLLTWFLHKVPSIQPQELKALGLVGDVTSFADRIKRLQVHECLYKTFGEVEDIVRGVPFFERDSIAGLK